MNTLGREGKILSLDFNFPDSNGNSCWRVL